MVNNHSFLVYGMHQNIFTARADTKSRETRLAFLEAIGTMSFEHPDIPAHVIEAAHAFMRACSFVSTEWDGRESISYDADGYRYEGRRCRTGLYSHAIRTFEHVCKTVFPFTLKAAPP